VLATALLRALGDAAQLRLLAFAPARDDAFGVRHP
jgi:hypothetical protein